MPNQDIWSWSTDASLNGAADTGIAWHEGQSRASVNDSARAQMAAHAKDRDIRTGVISAGGVVNALTFVSGVGYTTTPLGFTVRLNIPAVLTNTGPCTLNMDGIGAVAVLTNAGSPLFGGELRGYQDFRWDGTNWIAITAAVYISTGNVGKLNYVSATSLNFLPYNGNQIIINGVAYVIPPAGIAGLASTTSVFVNGVAAQPLVANVHYWIYAFNNAGVLTADFCTTGHSPSGTGVEIKTGDASRILIGFVRMDAAAHFVSSLSNRSVRSWYNRDSAVTQTNFTTTRSTTSTTADEVNSEIRATTLLWNDETWVVSTQGSITRTAANEFVSTTIGIDGAVASGAPSSIAFMSSSGQNFPYGLSYAANALTESQHYATVMGLISAGAGQGEWRGTTVLGYVMRR